MTPAPNRQKLRDEHPDTWIAVETGDELEGEVVDVTEAWSDHRQGGSFYPLLIVCTADGTEQKVHCFGAVLFNEIMRQRPEVGEIIRILYRGAGKAKQRGMNPPDLYSVRMPDRANQAGAAYDRIEGKARNEAPPKPVEPDVPIDTSDTEDIPF